MRFPVRAVLGGAAFALLAGCGGTTAGPVPTITPTIRVPSPTPLPTETAHPSSTPTASPTTTPTASPTASPTVFVDTCGNRVVGITEDCDDGNRFGGDDCASNCTFETERTLMLDEEHSSGTLYSGIFTLYSPRISGMEIWRLGKPDADGVIPVAVRAADIRFEPIRVTGLVCACVRGATDPQFGPGNAAAGEIGCGANGLTGVNIDLSIDHDIGDQDPACTTGTLEDGSAAHPHTGVCNGPPEVTRSGQGPAGSVVIGMSTAIATIADGGTCGTETTTRVCEGGTNPGTNCTSNAALCLGGGMCVAAKGPDGIPCNGDDPPVSRGTPRGVLATTGRASARIFTAGADPDFDLVPGAVCGSSPCDLSVSGMPLECARLASDLGNGFTGMRLASVDAMLDAQHIGDVVVTTVRQAK